MRSSEVRAQAADAPRENKRSGRPHLAPKASDERPYRAIVESASMGIGLITPEGRLEYSNPRLAEIFGFRVEELEGMSIADLVVPDERERVAKEVRSRIDKGDSSSTPIDAIGRRKDGGQLHIQVSISPHIVGGTLLGYQGFVTNVSEVVANARNCFKICSLLKSTFNSLTSGIIFARVNHQVCYVNDAVEMMFEVPSDGLLDQPLDKALSHLQGSIDASPDLLSLPEGQGLDEAGKLVEGSNSRGQISLRVYQTAVSNDEGDALGHLMVIDDLTQTRKLEQELYESRRLSFMGRLAASVAHEVNAPLTNIALLEARLRSSLKSADPAVLGMLDSLKDQWKAIHGLTSDLLRLSYGGSPGEEVVEVNTLVDSVISATRDILPSTVEISRTPPATPLKFRINRGEMERALTCLLTNGSDSMDGAGKISLAWSPASRGMVEIRVSDTGSGIPPELQEKVFEPFFTTKGLGQRMGLGLTLARNIVESHGGRLLLESEPGTGSTFRILLPRCVDDSSVGG